MRTRSRAGLGALSHLKHRHPRQLIVCELASHQLKGRVVPHLAPPRRRARVARSALPLGFQRPRPDARLLAAPPSSEALRLEPLPGRRLSVSLEPGLDVPRQSLTLLALLHRPRGSPAPPPRDSRAKPLATSLCWCDIFSFQPEETCPRQENEIAGVTGWEPALSHRPQSGGTFSGSILLMTDLGSRGSRLWVLGASTSSPLSPIQKSDAVTGERRRRRGSRNTPL